MKGLAHVTGGGLPGKVPGILPAGVAATFRRGSWEIPPIFSLIQREGNISEDEMFRVFNMGLGMVAVCQEAQVDTVLQAEPDAVVVGSVVERTGEEQVIFTT